MTELTHTYAGPAFRFVDGQPTRFERISGAFKIEAVGEHGARVLNNGENPPARWLILPRVVKEMR